MKTITRKLIVQLINPPREHASTGSKTFRTTYSFPDVKDRKDAERIISRWTENRRDGSVSLWRVKRAVYQGKEIVKDGKVTV